MQVQYTGHAVWGPALQGRPAICEGAAGPGVHTCQLRQLSCPLCLGLQAEPKNTQDVHMIISHDNIALLKSLWRAPAGAGRRRPAPRSASRPPGRCRPAAPSPHPLPSARPRAGTGFLGRMHARSHSTLSCHALHRSAPLPHTPDSFPQAALSAGDVRKAPACGRGGLFGLCAYHLRYHRQHKTGQREGCQATRVRDGALPLRTPRLSRESLWCYRTKSPDLETCA